MTRKEFLKICGLLSVGMPIYGPLASCKGPEKNFSGKVLIIGAGAAGLSAGHLLAQRGIEFQILEATDAYGGRMRTNTSFADFPIPMGAEWLHVGTDTFAKIVNDDSVDVNVNTVGYNSNDSYGYWNNGTLTLDTLGNWDDRKFVNGTWLNFFETYIVPSVAQNILYETVVTEIDYSTSEVIVKTDSDEFIADKVIVTIPLKMLQNGNVNFIPSLPNKKVNAINDTLVWDGIKVFLEFSQKFYPTLTEYPISPSTAGQFAYYDAAYGQNTNKNILGLFAVGSAAQPYIIRSGDGLKEYILDELDSIFSGQATPGYVNHIVQNWSQEPYFEGAYLNDHENWNRVANLFDEVDDKVYFAGEAYTRGQDWGSVHTAAEAARDTVDKFSG